LEVLLDYLGSLQDIRIVLLVSYITSKNKRS